MTKKIKAVVAFLVIAAALDFVLMTPIGPAGAAGSAHLETTGSLTHTWSNYKDAGGTAGNTIPIHTKVAVACRVNGFKVADGDTWWYLIASKPWADKFYASADAFYNNKSASGPLRGTPFYDVRVPICAGSVGPYAETTGSVTHTWSDYSDAGGTEGTTIRSNETVQITCAIQGFRVADGDTWWYRIASSPWRNDFYASADAFYDNGQIRGSLHGTPFVDPAVPVCAKSVVTHAETTDGHVNTWSDFVNAGGDEGPEIGSNQTVQVTCAIQGFKMADGNTWWYQIASGPWSNNYYASADGFFNGEEPPMVSPFVDPTVPLCANPVAGYAETTGSMANTWSNYADAGGTQGPNIGSNETVLIACTIQGFKVADGDTWWYQIASSPWNKDYYVSADAFYNNGQTTGSLLGTPFVDPAVPICA